MDMVHLNNTDCCKNRYRNCAGRTTLATARDVVRPGGALNASGTALRHSNFEGVHLPNRAAPTAPAKRASGVVRTGACRASDSLRSIMALSQKPPVRK